jgi:hypothetical protein
MFPDLLGPRLANEDERLTSIERLAARLAAHRAQNNPAAHTVDNEPNNAVANLQGPAAAPMYAAHYLGTAFPGHYGAYVGPANYDVNAPGYPLYGTHYPYPYAPFMGAPGTAGYGYNFTPVVNDPVNANNASTGAAETHNESTH